MDTDDGGLAAAEHEQERYCFGAPSAHLHGRRRNVMSRYMGLGGGGLPLLSYAPLPYSVCRAPRNRRTAKPAGRCIDPGVKSANNRIGQLASEARRSSAFYAAKWVESPPSGPCCLVRFQQHDPENTKLGAAALRQLRPHTYMYCRLESRHERGVICPPRYHDDRESLEAGHPSGLCGDQIAASSDVYTQTHETRRPLPMRSD
ncbi:hypothetical protein LZ30DRAFT_402747 [Colletotrichum cereale]|nr:hypothetical protein LZ30DRAFT_402747 [Colletotrichum cereale]